MLCTIVPLPARRRFGDGVGAFAVDPAPVGEEQHRIEAVGGDNIDQTVFLFGHHAHHALAAAPLRAVGGRGHALDVAVARQQDGDFFVAHQIGFVEFGADAVDHVGAAVVAEFLGDFGDVFADDARGFCAATPAGLRDKRCAP